MMMTLRAGSRLRAGAYVRHGEGPRGSQRQGDCRATRQAVGIARRRWRILRAGAIPLIIIAVAVILAMVAGACYAIWLSHEEAKSERAKFARIAQAQSESRERINYPPHPQKSNGFKQPERVA